MMSEFKTGKIYNGFKIINKFIKNGMTYYECECLECGNITEKYSSNIMKRGCAICSNKIVIRGINDLSTTHPYLMEHVVDKEEAFTHSFGSSYKIKVKCQYCGYEKRIAVHNFVSNGVSCNHCGDGISYPNKYMTEFMIQSGIDFENEKLFDWSKHKIYDIYIPQLNMIIENQGAGHYNKNGFGSLKGKTLEENIKNDILKKRLAIDNGINKYIEVDCKISDADYIRESIINSGLLQILNISDEDINWVECGRYASSNLVKTICEYYNDTNLSSIEIGKKFKLTKTTIGTYLKAGNKNGWCKYDPKQKMRERGAKVGYSKSKEIICLDNGLVYHNSRILKEDFDIKFGVKLDENGIRSNCRGVNNTHKGFHFYYTENLKEIRLRCVSYEEGSGRLKGTLGSLVIDYKGNNVSVGSGFSDADRKAIWDNREDYIGRVIEVKYKEITTDKKTGKESLQFPVYCGTRELGKPVSYN